MSATVEPTLSLTEMTPGTIALVCGYQPGSQAYRAKLLSMGLTTGTEVRLDKLAPLGDPVEITVRGFRLSLRKHEAQVLKLRRKA